MPITTNSGGILHTLSPIYARNGGILNELSTVYANTGGVLSTIYSKDSGGGGEDVDPDPPVVDPDPPVSETKTINLHWGGYTGTANNNPMYLGKFTVDQSTSFKFKRTSNDDIEKICSTPTKDMLSGFNTNYSIQVDYKVNFKFHLKTSNDSNTNDYWSQSASNWSVTYVYHPATDDFTLRNSMSSGYYSSESSTTTLSKGTYYVYITNYIYINVQGYKSGTISPMTKIVKYLPWDNMSADFTLTLTT